MNNFESGKRTGNEGISTIPSHWKFIRIKYLTEVRKDISINGKEELLSVSEYKGIVKRRELKINDENLSRSEDLSGYRIVKKGDLVSNIMLVWKRGLGVSPFDGIVSPAYSVFSFNNNCIPAYFNYLFRTDEYITEFTRHSTGIIMSRLRLYDDSFGSIFSHLPPLKEQQLISKYLDKRTKGLDILIEKIEKKIDLLKEQKTSLINQFATKGLDPNVEMKDSGVDWIKKIPKHWSLKKISHIVNFIGSGTTPKSNIKEYYENGELNWLITGDLNDQEIYATSKKITKKALRDTSLKEYPQNCLVIAMYGATIGKLGILKIKSTVNQACCVLNLNDNQDINFWFNSFLGNRKYLISLGYGGGQPNISQETIKGLKLPTPPTKSEQTLIAKEISILSNKINKLIKKHLKKKDLLLEYRKSLVSAVVTGKIQINKDML